MSMDQVVPAPPSGAAPLASTKTNDAAVKSPDKRAIGGVGALGFKIDEIIEQLSHSEGHSFDINDPSTINDEERELIATMRAADIDGDGTISLIELSKMGSQLQKSNALARHFKKIVTALGCLFIVVCFMLIGLVAAGVQMTKESRIPKGTGSAASVTTGGSEIPSGTATATATPSSRRLGSVSMKDIDVPRRSLEAMCPTGYDCTKENQAKKACTSEGGKWDAKIAWDDTDWCAACTGGPCDLSTDPASDTLGAGDAAAAAADAADAADAAVDLCPTDYHFGEFCGVDHDYCWELSNTLNCGTIGLDDNCKGACADGSAPVQDFTSDANKPTPEAAAAMKDPNFVNKHANHQTVGTVDMTWLLRASACLPNNVLKSVISITLVEHPDEKCNDDGTDDGTDCKLDHTAVTSAAIVTFEIKGTKIIDTGRVQFTAENNGIITLTKDSLQFDDSFNVELESMGFSCEDGTRTCESNGVSYISNADGLGNEVTMELEVNQMVASMNFDDAAYACMEAKSSAMVVPRPQTEYQTKVHVYKKCDPKLGTDGCVAVDGIDNALYTKVEKDVTHMKNKLGEMMTVTATQTDQECTTTSTNADCEVHVVASNKETGQTVEFKYEKETDDKQADHNGVAPKKDPVTGKTDGIKNCKAKQSNSDVTGSIYPQKNLLAAAEQTGQRRRLSHAAAHPMKRRMLSDIASGKAPRRLGRATLSSFDAHQFTMHALRKRDHRRALADAITPAGRADVGAEGDAALPETKMYVVYSETNMDPNDLSLGKNKPPGTAGVSTVIVTDAKGCLLWTATIPVDAKGNQNGAPPTLTLFTEACKDDTNSKSEAAVAGVEKKTQTFEDVASEPVQDMLGDMVCGPDMCLSGDCTTEAEPITRPTYEPTDATQISPTAPVTACEKPHFDHSLDYEAKKVSDELARGAEINEAKHLKEEAEEAVVAAEINTIKKTKELKAITEHKVAVAEEKVAAAEEVEAHTKIVEAKKAAKVAKEAEKAANEQALTAIAAEKKVLEDDVAAAEADLKKLDDEVATKSAEKEAFEAVVTAKTTEIADLEAETAVLANVVPTKIAETDALVAEVAVLEAASFALDEAALSLAGEEATLEQETAAIVKVKGELELEAAVIAGAKAVLEQEAAAIEIAKTSLVSDLENKKAKKTAFEVEKITLEKKKDVAATIVTLLTAEKVAEDAAAASSLAKVALEQDAAAIAGAKATLEQEAAAIETAIAGDIAAIAALDTEIAGMDAGAAKDTKVLAKDAKVAAKATKESEKQLKVAAVAAKEVERVAKDALVVSAEEDRVAKVTLAAGKKQERVAKAQEATTAFVAKTEEYKVAVAAKKVAQDAVTACDGETTCNDDDGALATALANAEVVEAAKTKEKTDAEAANDVTEQAVIIGGRQYYTYQQMNVKLAVLKGTINQDIQNKVAEVQIAEDARVAAADLVDTKESEKQSKVAAVAAKEVERVAKVTLAAGAEQDRLAKETLAADKKKERVAKEQEATTKKAEKVAKALVKDAKAQELAEVQAPLQVKLRNDAIKLKTDAIATTKTAKETAVASVDTKVRETGAAVASLVAKEAAKTSAVAAVGAKEAERSTKFAEQMTTEVELAKVKTEETAAFVIQTEKQNTLNTKVEEEKIEIELEKEVNKDLIQAAATMASAKKEIELEKEVMNDLKQEQQEAHMDTHKPPECVAFKSEFPFPITVEMGCWANDDAEAPDAQVCSGKGDVVDTKLIPGFEITYHMAEDSCLLVVHTKSDAATTEPKTNNGRLRNRRVRRLSSKRRTLNAEDNVKIAGRIDIRVTAKATDPHTIATLEALETGLSTKPMELGYLKQRIGTDAEKGDYFDFYLEETNDVLNGATPEDTLTFAFTKRAYMETGEIKDIFPRATFEATSGSFGTRKELICDDKFSVEKPEATAHRHGAREERPDVEDVKDTSGPRTSGPCDRIKTEDEPRCCKKDMDFDAQDICCTKQGGCFTKEDRKKETLEFAETEIVEAERKFETETLAKREKEAQKIVIDAQIKEVEAETVVLETKVAALEADKVVLETKVAVLDAETVELQTEVAAIEAETVELATEVAAIELVAGTLQNDLTQIAADKYDLEATEANLHVEEMELAFEATAIADTLATIETAAAKLDADLIAVNAEISAAADPTAKQAEKNTVVAAIAAKAMEKAAEVDKKIIADAAVVTKKAEKVVATKAVTDKGTEQINKVAAIKTNENEKAVKVAARVVKEELKEAKVAAKAAKETEKTTTLNEVVEKIKQKKVTNAKVVQKETQKANKEIELGKKEAEIEVADVEKSAALARKVHALDQKEQATTTRSEVAEQQVQVENKIVEARKQDAEQAKIEMEAAVAAQATVETEMAMEASELAKFTMEATELAADVTTIADELTALKDEQNALAKVVTTKKLEKVQLENEAAEIGKQGNKLEAEKQTIATAKGNAAALVAASTAKSVAETAMAACNGCAEETALQTAVDDAAAVVETQTQAASVAVVDKTNELVAASTAKSVAKTALDICIAGTFCDEETEAIYQTALDDAAIVVDTKLQEYSSATEFKAVIDTGFDNNELATYADSKSNELNAKVTEVAGQEEKRVAKEAEVSTKVTELAHEEAPAQVAAREAQVAANTAAIATKIIKKETAAKAVIAVETKKTLKENAVETKKIELEAKKIESKNKGQELENKETAQEAAVVKQTSAIAKKTEVDSGEDDEEPAPACLVDSDCQTFCKTSTLPFAGEECDTEGLLKCGADKICEMDHYVVMTVFVERKEKEEASSTSKPSTVVGDAAQFKRVPKLTRPGVTTAPTAANGGL